MRSLALLCLLLVGCVDQPHGKLGLAITEECASLGCSIESGDQPTCDATGFCTCEHEVCDLPTCKAIGCNAYDCSEPSYVADGICSCDVIEQGAVTQTTCRHTDEVIL